MNSRRCCREQSAPNTSRPSSTVLRRVRFTAEWAIPGVLLVLMPKCPMCLAAYVALFTGVGLSFSAAAHLRLLVLTLCVTTLIVLTARRAWALASHRAT